MLRLASCSVALLALLTGARAVVGQGGSVSAGAEVLSTSRPFVNQHALNRMACGPTSLLNALLAGDADHRAAFAALPGSSDRARLLGLCRSGGGKPSLTDTRRRRFEPANGVGPSDLLAWTGEVRAELDLPAVRGMFLERAHDESELEHLRRVHGMLQRSLAAGTPPIVRLRSFAATGQGKGGMPLWEAKNGHWVTVVELLGELRGFDEGFGFTFVDPASGQLASGYAHAERERNFTAALGEDTQWTWVTDRAFLLVTAPSVTALGLDGIDWHLRSTVTFDYAITAEQPLAGIAEPRD